MDITGSGTLLDPYEISAVPIIDPAAGNLLTCEPTGLRADLSASATDTACIDMTVSGLGTPASPLTISAVPIIDPAAGNLLTCEATGLRADLSTMDSASIDFSGLGTPASPLTAVAIAAASHTHDGTGGATSVVLGGLAEAGATVPVASSVGSIAIGDFANAGSVTGTQAIAIGSGSNATSAPSAISVGAIAIGASGAGGILGARAGGSLSIAIGSGETTTPGANSNNTGAIAIGWGSSAVQDQGIAIGTLALVSSHSGLALGRNARASVDGAGIAIGGGATLSQAAASSASGAIAIGGSTPGATPGAKASATSAIAIGSGDAFVAGAVASATGAVCIGPPGSTATGMSSVSISGRATALAATAIGSGAIASHISATALGNNAATTDTLQVNIGTHRMFAGCPDTAPADALLVNGQVSWWVTPGVSATLNFKVKDPAGVVKSGTVAIA